MSHYIYVVDIHGMNLVVEYLVWVWFKCVEFIYSEKATKFCEISTVDLPYLVPVKSTVEIS